MGQKTNPLILRTGSHLNRKSNFLFYSKKNYSVNLMKCMEIRKLILKICESANIANIDIAYTISGINIDIHAQKTGLIIGRGGNDIDKLKRKIVSISGFEDVAINVHDVKNHFLSAKIAADTIAKQIENRVSYKKAMKSAIQNALKQGCKGIKVKCGGRLANADIARKESYIEGRMPLHTLRADIDYATARAETIRGVIGVKVWIYRDSSKKYMIPVS